MTDQAGSMNYPDLLGAITGGLRLNHDVVQCAMAVRPSAVTAGHLFDVVLLIQSATDIDVDVAVTLELPERDQAGGKGRFSAKAARLLVGLRPAEMGVMTLPVLPSPTTQPGSGYTIGLKLDIKRLGKKAQRVRAVAGGGAFNPKLLPKATQQHLTELRELHYSADTGGKKNAIQTTFEVLPPALSSLKALKEQKADWLSLWTMHDYLDEGLIVQKSWNLAQTTTIHLKRDIVFMPLLRATQERFQACGYPLLPPEAICITKLLTLMLETEVPTPTPGAALPPMPHWFIRLCRILFQEASLSTQHEVLATQLLYDDLVHDAVVQGFAMITTVVEEHFGSAEETDRYAETLVESLREHQSLDLPHAYLPLVMGGLIGVGRVTMPREQVRDTVFMLSKALEKRRPERTSDNAFIFDITTRLIERALDTL